jgi:hypothetical protein
LDASPALVAGVIVTLLNDINRQTSAISASIGNENGVGSNADQEVSFWNNVYLCAGLTPVKVSKYLDIYECIYIFIYMYIYTYTRKDGCSFLKIMPFLFGILHMEDSFLAFIV